MTTIAPARTEQQTADLFRYGWRYVRRDLPDGSYTFDQITLTLEDVLYPEVGDFVVHTKAHEDRCRYFADVFNARLRHDSTAVVLQDVRVAWDVPGLRPNGPDIAVIFGLQQQQNWSTFDVTQEGVRPSLIIEVTSPETRSIDLVDKLDIYADGGVTWYIIIDSRRLRGVETLHVLGYVLTPTGYEVMAPDARGWLWLKALGVWVGVDAGDVRCYDTNSVVIGDYVSVDTALAEAELARQKAEQRIAELEAQLRKLNDAA